MSLSKKGNCRSGRFDLWFLQWYWPEKIRRRGPERRRDRHWKSIHTWSLISEIYSKVLLIRFLCLILRSHSNFVHVVHLLVISNLFSGLPLRYCLSFTFSLRFGLTLGTCRIYTDFYFEIRLISICALFTIMLHQVTRFNTTGGYLLLLYPLTHPLWNYRIDTP